MGGIKLGSLLGIPIRINLSFIFLLGFALLAWRSLDVLFLLMLTFGMVLLHELGHALAARRLRVPILGIEVNFFGGMARLGALPDSPHHEIVIAAAGPAVSFALALLAGGLYAVSGGHELLYHLALINLVLGAFNLLPALPMDGGRIFRALLSRRMGRLRATVLAVKVARGVALTLGLWGLFGIWPLAQSSLFLAALAALLWFMAGAELRNTLRWSAASPRGAGAWPGVDPAPQAAADYPPGVEVLDQDGRPLAGSPPRGFSVQQQQDGPSRRWILRGPDGQIIYVGETPYTP